MRSQLHGVTDKVLHHFIMLRENLVMILRKVYDCQQTFAERSTAPGQSVSTCLSIGGYDQCILDVLESVSAQPVPPYNSVHTWWHTSFGTWDPCCIPFHNVPTLQALSHTETHQSSHTHVHVYILSVYQYWCLVPLTLSYSMEWLWMGFWMGYWIYGRYHTTHNYKQLQSHC